jgi:hypothetical protein
MCNNIDWKVRNAYSCRFEIQPWERGLTASSLHALNDDPLSAAHKWHHKPHEKDIKERTLKKKRYVW